MIQQVRREVRKQNASGDETKPADVHEGCANLLRGKRAVYAPQARLVGISQIAGSAAKCGLWRMRSRVSGLTGE